MENSDFKCTCGNSNPLVKEILGRIDDFVFSKETGKINLGNVSNTTKGTIGIVKFQVIQDNLDKLQILVVADQNYSESDEKIFLNNWRERVGSKMKIEITIVDEIPKQSSGKFRIVKNNIKHLIS